MKLGHRLLLMVACASMSSAGCAVEVSPSATTGVPPGAPGPDIGSPPEEVAARTFNATMTGREVVPTVYGTRSTGTGSFTLDADGTVLLYGVSHTLTSPTEAHLHLGIAGASGTVLLPLSIVAGVIEGSLPVTPEQALAIREGRAYVDVHSADHPDGEIRGQIARPGEIVYVARLSADQVNPPTAADSDGLGAFLVDGTTRRVRFIVQVRGMMGAPTFAGIGLGPAGSDGPLVVDLADPKTPPSAELTGARTIAALVNLDLGRWYVDVRSRRFVSGELRGQVLRPGQQLYVSRMTGAESVPPVETSAGGSVSVIVDANLERVIYDAALTGMTPTAASLAEAPVGANGPVLMPFHVLGTAFRAMRMLPQSSTLLRSLAAGEVYASAASATYPAGEIRGQMRRVALPR